MKKILSFLTGASLLLVTASAVYSQAATAESSVSGKIICLDPGDGGGDGGGNGGSSCPPGKPDHPKCQ